MAWRPEDIHYNPDTGYPETRKERQRRLLEEPSGQETAGSKVTEYQIRLGLEEAKRQGRTDKIPPTITINGITHTRKEWEKIRQELLEGKHPGV